MLKEKKTIVKKQHDTNKKADKKKEREEKKRFKAVSNSLKLIPIINYDSRLSCFITNDNKYIDLIQIIAKDLSNVGEDITNYDAMLFEKLYKIYKGDFKIIFLDYPVDALRQIKYFKGRIENTINPVFLKYLKEKLAELEYLEKHRNNREFYIMIFSDSIEENIKNMNMLTNTLESLAREIDLDKKISIFHKLANKNIKGR